MNWIAIRIYQLYRRAIRYSKTTILFFTLIFGISLIGVSNLKTLTRLDDMLEEDFISTRENNRLKELFQSTNQFMVMIEKKENSLDQKDYCLLQHFSERLFQSFPDIKRIQSPFEIRHATYNPKDKTLWYPKIFENVCELGFDLKNIKRLSEDPWAGTLVPKNNSFHDILIEIHFQDHFDHHQIPEIKAWIQNELKETKLKTHFSGDADFQYYTNVGYEWLEKLNLAISVVLIGICYLFFRSLKSGLILITTLLITSLSLKGVMGFAGIPVDILTSNLFLMLTVSCIEDYILLSSLRVKSTLWRTPFRKIIIPSFLTSLTTLIGFWSLSTSEVKMIRYFGWIAGIGAVLEWSIIFLLFPAVIREFRSLENWVQFSFFPFWEKLERFLKKRQVPRKLVFLSLIVFPLGFWGAGHLRYQENPENTFWETHPFRQELNYVEKSRGFRNEVSLIFESDASKSKKDEMSRWLKTVPEISLIERPDVILNQLYEDVPKNIQDSFQSDVKESIAFERWISKTNEERWILYWKNTETNEMVRFQNEVRSRCKDECFIAGPFSAYSELGTKLSRTLLESLVISLILVGITLIFIARQQNYHRYGVILLSTFWGIFAAMTLLWITKTPIYFISCIFATVLVGLSGDNVIQYLWGTRRKETLHHTEDLGLGTSMLTITIISMALCFLGAYFVPARSLGTLFALGMTAMFFGDYFIWRAFHTTHPKK